MKSHSYEIVQLILRRGNKPGLITEWFAGMRAWADANAGPDAEALRLWLDLVKPRAFYTAGELAKLWPALQVALGLEQRLMPPPSANRLANELKFFGLPVLQCSNGLGSFFYTTDVFHGTGRYSHTKKNAPFTIPEFFIVEHTHKWRGMKLSQEEFEDALHN